MTCTPRNNFHRVQGHMDDKMGWLCPLKAPVSSNFCHYKLSLRQQFSQGVNTKDIDCLQTGLAAYK